MHPLPHSTGSPGNYKAQIEAGKRLDSWSLESKRLICQIPASFGDTVWDEAEAIPP